ESRFVADESDRSRDLSQIVSPVSDSHVFDRRPEPDIRVSIAPVVREVVCDSLRTLREHLKVQVLTLLDHVPHKRSGRVGCRVILKNITQRRAEDATDDSVRNGLAIPCSNILPG